jgi:Helix-turn-helix domain
VFRNVSSEPTNQRETQPETRQPEAQQPETVQPDAAQSEPQQPEPMRITDPTVMRALAHPVRMALMELFGVHQTLTATQASEALGESPANCAFHLRTLAKYGFVEEAGGGRGRERPWRATANSVRIRVSTADLHSEQAQVAANALGQVWQERWFARIREAFATRHWAPEWEEAAGSSQTLTFLTPDELRGMREEIGAIISRHLDERRVDPSKRPPGALPVEIVSFAYPRQDLAAQLAAAGENGSADENDEGDEGDAPA